MNLPGDADHTLRPEPDRTPAPADTATPAPEKSASAPPRPRPLPAPITGTLPAVPPELRSHPAYEILRELGRGGMGVVYLARNRVMGRLEVLKVLQDRFADCSELTQRFTNEIHMAARLQHPNIVVAYNAFQAGTALVLAMEYIEGQTLGEVVKRDGPLPVAQACAYARQVALGLQRAHEKGMVHRDIKPHNLMVNREDEVKVLDFGLAKVASEESGSGLTEHGDTMGTPDYMSPEQARDTKSADVRADIYSLGCTLFFLLTGKPPFTGLSPYEVMAAHQSEPPPPLAAARPGVPAGLAALMVRMLAKRPKDRPQVPGEVAKALLPFCEPAGGAGAAAPAAQPDWQGPPAGVGWALTVAVASLVALVVVLVGLWAGGSFSPGPSGPRSSERGEGSETKTESGPDKDKGKGQQKKGPPGSLTNSVGMTLVPIPKGTFHMGSLKEEMGRDPDDEPRHEVELTEAFHLGMYEVTQGQFQDVMGYNPAYFSKDGKGQPGANYTHEPAGGKDHVAGKDTAHFPVENVSYDEAVAFCKKLTDRDRKAGKIGPRQEYRLPTEAQWEHSCRAGTTTAFHLGDKLSSKEANFNGEYPYGGANKGPSLGRTAEVGQYPANGLGLHDMHGNVLEWCADWYDQGTYKAVPSPRVDPVGPAGDTDRVVRGGSWVDSGWRCRSAHRSRYNPTDQDHNLGFRVALVSSKKK